ncbi:MAG: carboxylating nicotinate-nucleotide diphosphorylase [Oleiphilaceae bacterium]|nr:carboxylating nicotinate-nucleotide diphosphorylase [Oleiphilaceae bacterium]
MTNPNGTAFSQPHWRETLVRDVRQSIEEDLGDGDLTAGLIPATQWVSGRVISRQPGVMAGRPWVEEVFRQLDPAIELHWQLQDGERIDPDLEPVLFRFRGPARAVMSAERSALNWLQTLSGVASRCRQYADLVAHTRVQLLDTRKTLPGLRMAQKYAVVQGGCCNHRLGLFDAFLIKENHIAACGSITAAVQQARRIAPDKPLEVEAENPGELAEAAAAGADIVMLDEFSLSDMRQAVQRYSGQIRLEASGGINDQNLVAVAETGVDAISLGTLTKDLMALDLSMRVSDAFTVAH